MSEEELIKFFDDLIGGFNTNSWEKGSEADYINQSYNYVCKIKQENQQLKEKIKTYEDPEDLTLMFMYCDEKAKDKIKQLKEEINKMSKKEIKVRDMLYSIENGTLTRERLMQIEEVLFEIGGEDNE